MDGGEGGGGNGLGGRRESWGGSGRGGLSYPPLPFGMVGVVFVLGKGWGMMFDQPHAVDAGAGGVKIESWGDGGGVEGMPPGAWGLVSRMSVTLSVVEV